MRACRRSSSLTSASPISTRVMPGFFSANDSSITTVCSACATPSVCSVVILLMNENSVVSMNSIRPSYIWALLAKWR